MVSNGKWKSDISISITLHFNHLHILFRSYITSYFITLLHQAFYYLNRMLYSTPAKEDFRVSPFKVLVIDYNTWPHSLFNCLQDYLKWLVTPAFEHFGFNQKQNDSSLDILTRNLLLSWACRLEVPECTNSATNLYRSWMNESSAFKYANFN